MSSGFSVKLLIRTAPCTPCGPVIAPTQTRCACPSPRPSPRKRGEGEEGGKPRAPPEWGEGGDRIAGGRGAFDDAAAIRLRSAAAGSAARRFFSRFHPLLRARLRP